MQTLDVQATKPANGIPPAGSAAQASGLKSAQDGKTGAETARNGSSFLAMIEKMIAGSKDGKAEAPKLHALKNAGRGAGDGVPGEENTLIKQDAGKLARIAAEGSARDRIPRPDSRARNARQGGAAVAIAPGKIPGQKPRAEGEVSAKIAIIANAGKKDTLPAGLASLAGDGKANEPQTAEKAEPRKGERRANTEDALLAGLFAGKADAERATAGAAARLPSGAGGSGPGSVEADSPGGAKVSRSDRKDRKAVIGVRDERTEFPVSAHGESSFVKSVKDNGDGSADMTIGFRSAENGRSSVAGQDVRLAERRDGEGQSFASMLSQELRSNAADFVKTGQIVLRDNNSGLIRLTLNPESLGNVKISLELSGDKKISGKIVVSSQEAYEAFNESLDGLSQAFVEGGFESAGFDLSWTDGEGRNHGEGQRSGAVSSPFYASSIPDVMSGSDAADMNMGGYRFAGSSAINVFA